MLVYTVVFQFSIFQFFPLLQIDKNLLKIIFTSTIAPAYQFLTIKIHIASPASFAYLESNPHQWV